MMIAATLRSIVASLRSAFRLSYLLLVGSIVAIVAAIWGTWVACAPLLRSSLSPAQLEPGQVIIVLGSEWPKESGPASATVTVTDGYLSAQLILPHDLMSAAPSLTIIQTGKSSEDLSCADMANTPRGVTASLWRDVGYGDDELFAGGPGGGHDTAFGPDAVTPGKFAAQSTASTLDRVVAGLPPTGIPRPLLNRRPVELFAKLKYQSENTGTSDVLLDFACSGDFVAGRANPDGTLAVGFADIGFVTCAQTCSIGQSKADVAWDSSTAPASVSLQYGARGANLNGGFGGTASVHGVSPGPRALLADVERQSAYNRRTFLVGVLLGLWGNVVVSIAGAAIHSTISKLPSRNTSQQGSSAVKPT